MMHFKVILMFKLILAVILVCLATPLDADDDCIWCDHEISRRFIRCMSSISSRTIFKNSKALISSVTSDLLKVEEATKNDGPIREITLKGALTFEYASALSKDPNSDKKNKMLPEIVRRCYRKLNKSPDEVFIKKLSAILQMKEEEKSDTPATQQPIQPKQQPKDEIPQNTNDFNSPSQNNNAQSDQENPSDEQPTAQNPNVLNVNANSFYENQENNQRNPFNEQPTAQYDPALQKQTSDSIIGGNTFYQNQENEKRFLYDKQQSQGQKNFQEPETSQRNINTFSYSAPNPYNSFPERTPTRQQTTLQNNNQEKPNAYQSNNQNYPLRNMQSQDYQQQKVFWNNENNRQQYNPNFSFYPPNRNPSIDNGQYLNDKYLRNQYGFSRTEGASFANSYNTQQNNNDYSLTSSDSSASAQVPSAYNKPQRNYDYSTNYRVSSAEAESSASSSFKNDRGSSEYFFDSKNKPQLDSKQKNVPSTTNYETQKALKFSEHIYITLCDKAPFKKTFHTSTTNDKVAKIMPYVLFSALRSCGYPRKISREIARDSSSFRFPEGSTTEGYAEAICKMLMVQFNSKDLLGDDPEGQGECLGNAIPAILDTTGSPEDSPKTQNNKNPDFSSPTQQNLPEYPTKNANDHPDYANYNTFNQQVKSNSFTGKELNQQPGFADKGINYYNDGQFYEPYPNLEKAKQSSFQNPPNINNDYNTYLPSSQQSSEKQEFLVKENDQNYKNDQSFDPYPNLEKTKQSNFQNAPNVNNGDDFSSSQQSPEQQAFFVKKNEQNSGNPNNKNSDVGQQDGTFFPVNDSSDNEQNNDDDGDTDGFDDGSDNGGNDGTDNRNGGSNDDDDYPDENDYSDEEYFSDKNGNPDYPDEDDCSDEDTNDDGDNITVPSKQPSKQPPLTDDKQSSKLNDIEQMNFATTPAASETSRDKDFPQNTNKQTSLTSDDTSAFHRAVSGDDHNPDTNLGKKNANDAATKERVKFLMKQALDCKKSGKFDYKAYGEAIAGLIKDVQEKTGCEPKDAQTKVLIEAVVAVTQLLMKSDSNKKDSINADSQEMQFKSNIPEQNSKQNYQNVQQNNLNSNDETGQTSTYSETVTQDKTAYQADVDYSAPKKYPPQDQEIPKNKLENDYQTDQNSQPIKEQDTPISQEEPQVFTNSVPQQTNSRTPENGALEINRNFGNQVRPEDSRSFSSLDNSNANSQQFAFQTLTPGQINTNQRKSDTESSNAGVTNFNMNQYPFENQDNLAKVNSQSFMQNGNQGRYPQENNANNPSLTQTGNRVNRVPLTQYNQNKTNLMQSTNQDNSAFSQQNGMNPQDFMQNGRNPQSFIQNKMNNQDFMQNGMKPQNFMQNGMTNQNFMQSEMNNQNFKQNGMIPQNFMQNEMNSQDFKQNGRNPQSFIQNIRNNQDFMQNGMKPQNFMQSGMNSQDFVQNGRNRQSFMQNEMNNQNYNQNGIIPQSFMQNGRNPQSFMQSEMNNQNFKQNGMKPQNLMQNGMNSQNFMQNGMNPQDMMQNGMKPQNIM